MIMAQGPKLWIEEVEAPGRAAATSNSSLTIRRTEQEHIRTVLDLTGWRVRRKDGAADTLRLEPLDSRKSRGYARHSPWRQEHAHEITGLRPIFRRTEPCRV